MPKISSGICEFNKSIHESSETHSSEDTGVPSHITRTKFSPFDSQTYKQQSFCIVHHEVDEENDDGEGSIKKLFLKTSTKDLFDACTAAPNSQLLLSGHLPDSSTDF